MKRALCLWLPHWPLQRLAAARAELKEQAVLLYRLHATRGARVVAYCAPACEAAAAPWRDAARGGPRGAGIRPDMPLAEATALAGYAHSAPPHLELHDPAADRVALEALAEQCQHHSPSVGLEEGDSPESLLLDVTGLGPLVGGEPALAARVVRACQERGLVARAAVADTIGAAWAVAHFAELTAAPTANDTSDAAAIMAALRTPIVVPPGQTWQAVAPLSVAALRLPPETRGLLGELGLRRIDQVAALARPTLLARFGPGVLARLDQATGAAPEAIVARPLPAECRFEWLFEYPTGRHEMIDFALGELIARACQALARERRGVLRLECRFDTVGRQAQRFVVGLYRPNANPRHVGELARLKLESLRFVEPVSAICLTVLAADRLEYRQRQIFAAEESRREASRELAALVDRLSNRLGAQAVLRPWLLAGAQPEFACQYRPLASLSARGGTRGRQVMRASKSKHNQRRQAIDPARAADGAGQVPGDRPLHLHRRPLRLDVMSLAPEGPPIRFRLAGHDHRVSQVWGPERIETGWWRTRCVRRDYYQVETAASGQRFWLFRELHSGRWFLHGEFV